MCKFKLYILCLFFGCFLIAKLNAQTNRTICVNDVVYIDNGDNILIAHYKEEQQAYTGTVSYECRNEKGHKKNNTEEYKNGLRDGNSFTYYNNGKIETHYFYKQGKLENEGKEYTENGKLIFHAKFKNGDTLKVFVNKLDLYKEEYIPRRYKIELNDTAILINTKFENNILSIDLVNITNGRIFIDTTNLHQARTGSRLEIYNICDTVNILPCFNETGVTLKRVSSGKSIQLNYNISGAKTINILLYYAIENYKYGNPMSKYLNTDDTFRAANGALLGTKGNFYTQKTIIIEK